jgi:hypothetical protein
MRPERIGQSSDKRSVAGKFLFAREMRPRRSRRANGDRGGFQIDGNAARVRDQAEADLPAARELDVDLRKQLRVEERAMLHAMAAVDAEAHAQCV